MDEQVRILNLGKKVRILKSLRKPKRLDFVCSDNKKRSMLVKCGEDLRSDARVMTIFKIINSVIGEDSNINTQLFTYNIFPINNDVGIIQWVDDSTPMKSLIEQQMQEDNIHDNISFD